jgi:hypothetical protein
MSDNIERRQLDRAETPLTEQAQRAFEVRFRGQMNIDDMMVEEFGAAEGVNTNEVRRAVIAAALGEHGEIMEGKDAKKEITLRRHLSQFRQFWNEDAKEKCQWSEIRKRLEDADGYYRGLLDRMNNPVFIGYDEDGDPLFFATTPDMIGASYEQTYDAIYGKGEGDADKKNHYGYSMPPTDDSDPKWTKLGGVIKEFQMTTERPFTRRDQNGKALKSWLDCGRTPKNGNVYIATLSESNETHINSNDTFGRKDLGVQKMLKLRKLPKDFGAKTS